MDPLKDFYTIQRKLMSLRENQPNISSSSRDCQMSTMMEVVWKYEHQGSIISSSSSSNSSSSNKAKWLKHYSSDHRILLVGEGDFSFSLSLAMAFGDASKIVATSLDSYDVVIKKYKGAKTNLEILHSLGAELLHEVDAFRMKLHKNLQMQKFDRIIYNFPHAGFLGGESDIRVIMLHRNLVCGFLKNASGMLLPKGEVHVAHKTSEPYRSWNIEELATQNSLTLLERIKFKLEDYPGYSNKRGDGMRPDASFPLGECSTYKFVLFSKCSNSSKKDGLCKCDPPLRRVEYISWTKKNPNRRFMGCPEYRAPESEHCEPIYWIDPPQHCEPFNWIESPQHCEPFDWIDPPQHYEPIYWIDPPQHCEPIYCDLPQHCEPTYWTGPPFLL